MSLELMIYLGSVSDKAGSLFFITSFVFLLITIFCCISNIDDLANGKKVSWKYFFISLAFAMGFMFSSILIPSEKTIYSIAAIKMGKELSKNEKVIETSDKVYKLLNQKLDELIEKKIGDPSEKYGNYYNKNAEKI